MEAFSGIPAWKRGDTARHGNVRRDSVAHGDVEEEHEREKVGAIVNQHQNKPAFNPRPYQAQAKDALHEALQKYNSVLCTMPTGTGKTVVIALLCQDVAPKRVMVLAHRGELIWQNAHSIARQTGATTGIEMGGHRLIPNAPQEQFMFDAPDKFPQVISATIQTLAHGNEGSGRYSKFAPTDIDYLIIDEAHRTITPSYLKIIKYFKQNPNLKIIGFTATPKRHDKKAMGAVYEHVAYHYDILEAVNDGWLVPPVMHPIKVTDLVFANIRTVAGDFDREQLAKVMEQEKPLHEMVASACDIIGREKAICFCHSVDQSIRMCEIFNRYRLGMAVHIDGETHEDDRKARFALHRSGKAQVLCNVGIATEGYDDPTVKWLLMAKPTKSVSLYTQMLGRGLRPLGGVVDKYDTPEDRQHAIAESDKPICSIVDYVGISGKHHIASAIDVLGGELHADTVKAAKKRAEERKTPITVTQLLEDEKKRQHKILEKRVESRERITAKCKYVLETTSPFRPASDVAMKKAQGDWTEPTIGQQQFLAKHKINSIGMTRKEAQFAMLGILERFKKGYCRPAYQQILDKARRNSNVSDSQAVTEINQMMKEKYSHVFKKALSNDPQEAKTCQPQMPVSNLR